MSLVVVYSIICHYLIKMLYNLAVPVTFISVPTEIVKAIIGDKVQLICRADGYPLPKVTWSRPNGLPKGAVVTSNGSLDIYNISREDFGQYKCIAENSIGSQSYTLSLSPTGKHAQESSQ